MSKGYLVLATRILRLQTERSARESTGSPSCGSHNMANVTLPVCEFIRACRCISLERMYMSGTPGRGTITPKLMWRMVTESQYARSAMEKLKTAIYDGSRGYDDLQSMDGSPVIVLEQEWQLAGDFPACN